MTEIENKTSAELAFTNAPVTASTLRGAKLIADIVKRLPDKPGVYRMIDTAGQILYVGKARNLKNRVTSYSRPTGHSNRIARMISLTASMEFITTETETEALLLETNLIKKMKPRFNVLMRDDKSFPYILIATDHEAPSILKHRGARNIKGRYFGPFASGFAVNHTLDTLQKAFLLRSCSDSIYASRTRPCLLHQIKRCSAPCTREIDIESYQGLVKDATDFLLGRTQQLRATLAGEMESAAENMDYERAAQYRDRIAALAPITTSQGINLQNLEEADAFSIIHDGGEVCVQIFFIRNYQNWGNRAYFLRADASMDNADVLQDFIMQFYDERPAPSHILVSNDLPECELVAKALCEKSGHKVNIIFPKSGEKKDLINHALRNANEALSRRLAESAAQNKLLGLLAERFELPNPPARIEVYDNSHIMGAQAVGAMVVAGPDGFIKNQYRKWTIKNEELSPGDDYGMMREVFTRRFSRLIKESADETNAPTWPDLILVDGGKGQLDAVNTVLNDLNIGDKICVIGIAKGVDRHAGRERFFRAGRDPFQLPERDPVLYFVQRLRDEAHRFVIGAHRAKRSKAIVANPLDEIAGIGPTRKRALMRHFGTTKEVSRASLDDLAKVPGINAATAQQIWSFFNAS